MLQGNLISPMLFYLYINDFKELIKIHMKLWNISLYWWFMYLCKGINQLLNKIERWSESNGIKVNKKKNGIMILKGNEDRIEI